MPGQIFRRVFVEFAVGQAPPVNKRRVSGLFGKEITSDDFLKPGLMKQDVFIHIILVCAAQKSGVKPMLL